VIGQTGPTTRAQIARLRINAVVFFVQPPSMRPDDSKLALSESLATKLAMPVAEDRMSGAFQKSLSN
jgi:hypothetical protein